MLGLIKAMPLILLVAGGAYAYHTTTVSKAEAQIARLEVNIVVLKENAAKLDAAFEAEKAARERSEQNL